jgi:hypothetical protein
MPKKSGLGQAIYVGGYDLSGDVGAVQTVSGGPDALEVTAINESAPERIGGIKSGEISFNSWFNTSAGQEHPALSSLPTTDRIVLYVDTPAIGGAAAGLNGKQINYDSDRAADGSLALSVQVLSNGETLEWCEMLTAGKRTDSTATTGASIDFGSVSSLFGASGYLEVFSVTGTSVTVTIEDSADNGTFAAVTGLAFTAVTPGGAPSGQRLETLPTATIRRYVRATTTGTFSNAVFAVGFIRHLTATL